MQLTLVLPNLLDIAPAELALAKAPSLTRLLATSKRPDAQPDGVLAVACQVLGLARQNDWPVAPWLARAAGIDPGTRYWLRADPVTLDVGRDRGVLAGIVRDLGADESAALLASLRAHFVSDGIEFVERGPGRWWIALDTPQRTASSAPIFALGHPLAAHLPRGADAPRWRRWQSEIQMLLFEHPVNRSREERGRPPINYLWLWGGGVLRREDAARSCSALVFTRADWLRDLALAVGATVADPPRSWADHRIADAGPAIVCLDPFDPATVQEQLAAFDAEWAAPLQREVDSSQLELRLVLAGSATSLSFAPCPHSGLQRLRLRWSRAPSLPEQLMMSADREGSADASESA